MFCRVKANGNILMDDSVCIDRSRKNHNEADYAEQNESVHAFYYITKKLFLFSSAAIYNQQNCQNNTQSQFGCATQPSLLQ